MKGVKTETGIVELYVETTGVSEDKFDGKCFKFIGERWFRSLSYFSKDAVRVVNGRESKRSQTSRLAKTVKEIKDMVKEVKLFEKERKLLFFITSFFLISFKFIEQYIGSTEKN